MSGNAGRAAQHFPILNSAEFYFLIRTLWSLQVYLPRVCHSHFARSANYPVNPLLTVLLLLLLLLLLLSHDPVFNQSSVGA